MVEEKQLSGPIILHSKWCFFWLVAFMIDWFAGFKNLWSNSFSPLYTIFHKTWKINLPVCEWEVRLPASLPPSGSDHPGKSGSKVRTVPSPITPPSPPPLTTRCTRLTTCTASASRGKFYVLKKIFLIDVYLDHQRLNWTRSPDVVGQTDEMKYILLSPSTSTSSLSFPHNSSPHGTDWRCRGFLVSRWQFKLNCQVQRAGRRSIVKNMSMQATIQRSFARRQRPG